jgi:predicted nucleic acid-binding Zn ribbon protein
MKTCLNCQKEYPNKREASKFCSDKCRVAYNRKHPKKAPVSELQMQVLYNAVLELVGKSGRIEEKPAIASKTTYQPIITQQLPQVAIQAITHKYLEDKQEVTNADEHKSWLKRLNDDTRLSDEQKDVILKSRL